MGFRCLSSSPSGRLALGSQLPAARSFRRPLGLPPAPRLNVPPSRCFLLLLVGPRSLSRTTTTPHGAPQALQRCWQGEERGGWRAAAREAPASARAGGRAGAGPWPRAPCLRGLSPSRELVDEEGRLRTRSRTREGSFSGLKLSKCKQAPKPNATGAPPRRSPLSGQPARRCTRHAARPELALRCTHRTRAALALTAGPWARLLWAAVQHLATRDRGSHAPSRGARRILLQPCNSSRGGGPAPRNDGLGWVHVMR